MKELEERPFRKKNKFLLFLVLFCLESNVINGQLKCFYLNSAISDTLTKDQILRMLNEDKQVSKIKIDSTDKSYYTEVRYCRTGIDSALIKFKKNNFSSVHVYFADPCNYYYYKSYFLENFKKSKIKKTAVRKFSDKYYRYVITIAMQKKGDYSYSFHMISKKYQINY